MNLHNEIMNIPVPSDFDYADFPNKVYAYKSGHRDARHAAAELSLKAEARIEELEILLEKVQCDAGFRNLEEKLQEIILSVV